ncbi:hypothetical protein [Porphyromonas sp.]|uniref:hypothetical protein n=1 Tax=Porphyromonas sp. TaxID=1924944 RepID=UPI0026DA9D1C|nr:hypothetical protein [Porphyromonas sp.]MDO4770430.1 hypothetical protein [Porphyromonas sp.]
MKQIGALLISVLCFDSYFTVKGLYDGSHSLPRAQIDIDNSPLCLIGSTYI